MLTARQVADNLNHAGSIAQEFGANPQAYFDAQGIDGQAVYSAAVGVVRMLITDVQKLDQLKDALGVPIETVEQARMVAGTMIAMYLAGINGGIQLGRALANGEGEEDDE